MRHSAIEEIRSFNRFYTKIIGLLDRHILNSNYSLPEVRVLFELNQNPGLTATEIISSLEIDKGYLSRMLKKFERQQLIIKNESDHDKRAIHLSLSKLGEKEFKKLDQASSEQIKEIFLSYSDEEILALTRKMNEIKQLILDKSRG